MNYKIPQPKKSVVRNDDDSSLNTEFFECGGMFFFFADKAMRRQDREQGFIKTIKFWF